MKTEKPGTSSETPEPKTEAPKVTPAAAAKKSGAAKTSATEPRKSEVEPPADADPDVKEKFRFEQAKAKAAEDSHVKSLKAKADEATKEEESRKAQRAYNKALFDKIRRIDSSVSDRANRLEAAILKRITE